MNRSTLDSILEGMESGGWANTHSSDYQPGLGYVSTFDPSQLGRSGNEIINPGTLHTSLEPSFPSHYDVIERTGEGVNLHHRIYKP